jgi:hypothetical protein
MRTLPAQGMLQGLHGDSVQMPNVQEECRQHGATVAEADPGNRKSANA